MNRPTPCTSQRNRIEILIKKYHEQQQEKGGENAILTVCREDYETHYSWIEKQLNQHHIFLRIAEN